MFNQKEYNKKYYVENKEKYKKYYKDNLKKIKQYYQDNRDKLIEQAKQWHEDNQKKNPNRNKQYYQEHKKERNEYDKRWRERNPEYISQYFKKKRRTNLKFNLNYRMGTAIYTSLRKNKNGRHWETLVDYTLQDLTKHLKKTIPEGHTWQDYLEGRLHIDHIIPISVFNFTKPEHTDFKRCWALENLRLLLAEENLRKSNHLEKPFQPTLCLEF